MNSFSLLAVRDCFVCQRFCGFVAHAQLFKAQEAFVGHFPGLFAQVQLEVNFRKIEKAESEMVSVTRGLTGAPRGKEHFNCPAVFAAEVVQVGDVVVGLVAQQGHAVAFA